MYTSFFGFNENPFNLTPDPRYHFLSRYHKEALDHLLYGINERKGFITITGGIGTGKTTLCRAFLGHLDSSTKSALIFNSFISDNELLKTINQEFGIEMDPGAESKKDYIDALNQFLLQNYSKGENAVFIIDEAQNLSHSVLEHIRMLSNLETEKEKLIQIILVGQPELKELLVSPSLRQLDERITVRYDLQPLDAKDIKGYIEHRLVVAGSRGDVKFTKGALKKIFIYSRGNPRRINAVCDRSLLISYAKEKHTVSNQIVTKAIEEVRGNGMTSFRIRYLPRFRFGIVAIFTLLFFTVTAFTGWTLREKIAILFSNENTILPIKTRHIPRKPLMPQKKGSTLFLNEKISLSGLFNLVNSNRTQNDANPKNIHLHLFSLDVRPENYLLLKKPFRVQIQNDQSSSVPFFQYLLVREISNESVILVDTDGKEQVVTRDFLLNNWGSKVNWVFPNSDNIINLTEGMESSEILELQKILQEVGYQVKPTGVFDESMVHEIVKFQNSFGLKADGIVGPLTHAVLYLMT